MAATVIASYKEMKQRYGSVDLVITKLENAFKTIFSKTEYDPIEKLQQYSELILDAFRKANIEARFVDCNSRGAEVVHAIQHNTTSWQSTDARLANIDRAIGNQQRLEKDSDRKTKELESFKRKERENHIEIASLKRQIGAYERQSKKTEQSY